MKIHHRRRHAIEPLRCEIHHTFQSQVIGRTVNALGSQQSNFSALVCLANGQFRLLYTVVIILTRLPYPHQHIRPHETGHYWQWAVTAYVEYIMKIEKINFCKSRTENQPLISPDARDLRAPIGHDHRSTPGVSNPPIK